MRAQAWTIPSSTQLCRYMQGVFTPIHIEELEASFVQVGANLENRYSRTTRRSRASSLTTFRDDHAGRGLGDHLGSAVADPIGVISASGRNLCSTGPLWSETLAFIWLRLLAWPRGPLPVRERRGSFSTSSWHRL